MRREIEKQYLAICWGEFEQERGVIDQPIAVSRTFRGVHEARGGQRRRQTERDGVRCRETAARIHRGQATPRTGRAHQLRVHMAWLGHPIVGDKVYGPDETLYLQFIEKGVTNEMLDKLLLPRHALHAETRILSSSAYAAALRVSRAGARGSCGRSSRSTHKCGPSCANTRFRCLWVSQIGVALGDAVMQMGLLEYFRVHGYNERVESGENVVCVSLPGDCCSARLRWPIWIVGSGAAC